jgi:hypothetical protein
MSDMTASLPASELTLPVSERDDPAFVKEEGLWDSSVTRSIHSETNTTENSQPITQADKITEDKDLEKSDAPAEDDGVVYPGLWKAVILILAIFLSIFLVALDQTIIGTAIPRITDQFHSVGDVGWYGSAYFLTSTALQPSFGRIYKTFSVS